MEVLGIDIGGSGIKGAPIDVAGRLLAERCRLPTPDPADPPAVAEAVARIACHFAWRGPVGCAFPAVVKGGVALTAANIDPAWLGRDARALLAAATGRPTTVLNDADAAGLAEVRFGAGRGEPGVVLMLTLGTGVGTALFSGGVLLPNAQLGQVPVRGEPGDRRVSDAARRAARLSWAAWARRLDAFLARVDAHVWPDLIIIGGGVSEEHARFVPRLRVRARARVTPARLGNQAGIVGAALAAADAPRP